MSKQNDIAEAFNANSAQYMSMALASEAFPFYPVLVGYRGSLAHGMFIPNSDPDSIDDIDLMGVTIAPLSCYFGWDRFEHKETKRAEFDIITYELSKFIRLLCQSNPNVLSLLWLRPDHYLFKSALGKSLLDKRELFSSCRVYKSFTGYAYGQLKRMTHFKREGYMGAKRKELIERHGYDTKNAAHLIRLLRMGIQFLRDGVLYVYREHDASELLQIKRGAWTLDRVKQEADMLFQLAEYEYEVSPLPENPDYSAIKQWLQNAFVEHFDIKQIR